MTRQVEVCCQMLKPNAQITQMLHIVYISQFCVAATHKHVCPEWTGLIDLEEATPCDHICGW